jgi:hypothetical protein
MMNEWDHVLPLVLLVVVAAKLRTRSKGKFKCSNGISVVTVTVNHSTSTQFLICLLSAQSARIHHLSNSVLLLSITPLFTFKVLCCN